jgi:gliding motility-associated protein GldM
MINMMYLVLTALLAMNVSKEILNAFRTVNNSIINSNIVVTDKNNATYAGFADAIKDPQTAAKAAIWKPKADQVQSLVGGVYSDIEKVKQDLKKLSGLKVENGQEVFSEDNIDVPTRILIDQKMGTVIYDKMVKLRADLLATIKPEDYTDEATYRADLDAFEKNLPLKMDIPKSEFGKKYSQDGKGWSEGNFHMTPTVAALTILSKLQSDIKNSEAQLVDHYFGRIGKVKVVYDAFEAIASANTNYAMPGDPIEIYAGVGAFSDAAKPVISIAGSNVPLVNGMATFKTTASGAGERSIPVSITYVKPDGTAAQLKKDIKYTIGTPSGAAVMMDKMNVIYIGVENPLTVSSGSGAEKTNVSGVGGGLTVNKGSVPGKYIAKATTVGQATIKVNVTGGKGFDFPVRVKRIPDPIPTLGGKLRGGNAPAGTIKAQSGIVPILENFDFEARFNVQSFTMIYSSKGEIFKAEASGPLFNDQMNNFLTRCRPKDIIFIDDIKVVGPDGTPRKLGQIAFTII